MLRNTPKHQFRSNGVEWMLHNFGTPKQCIQSRNTSVSSFYPLKVSEIRWNTPKTSFWLQWRCFATLVPQNSAFRLGRKFCIFYLYKVSEILWNTPKHHFRSNGDVSQLWYPEIVHSGSERKFWIFYLSKVSEMLWNTPKNQFGSNGVEWMLHNFSTPKQCIQARNTSFASFTCRRFAKCSETLPNIILGQME
jgi:hypothetical protein